MRRHDMTNKKSSQRSTECQMKVYIFWKTFVVCFSDVLMFIFEIILLLYACKVPAFSGNFLERVLRLLQIIHHFVKSFQEPPFPRPTLFRRFLLSGNAGMKFQTHRNKRFQIIMMLSLKNFVFRSVRISSIAQSVYQLHSRMD